MPWTVKLTPSQQVKSKRKGFTKKGAVYPWFPAILDESDLTELTTFESGEKEFIRKQGREKRQYLTALYLKAISELGHSHFQLQDIPLQFRRELSEKLGLEGHRLQVQPLDKKEKNRIVGPIRTFLGISVPTDEDLNTLKKWLEENIAHRETDIQMVINAAVQVLSQTLHDSLDLI